MANTYLTRTPSGGSYRTATFSCWFKRGKLDNQENIIGWDGSGSQQGNIILQTANNIIFQSYNGSGFDCNLTTNRLFRDTNAWYHIVVEVDTTQATTSDRVKIYINGVQETSFSTANYPSLNADLAINSNYSAVCSIGQYNSGWYFTGSMSHIHWIDGTAYDASAFGETDATTGEWKINTSPSVTYGTNGFFILKDGNNVTDQSGNSNNFTVGGGTLTKTEDCPSNVFATWNGIADNLDVTLSNGNNTVAHGSQLERRPVISSLGASTGKYYAEFKPLDASVNVEFGIVTQPSPSAVGRYMNQNPQNCGSVSYKSDGSIQVDGTNTTGFSTYTANDIIGVAVDKTNELIYFYKNGTLENSGGTDFSGITVGDGNFYFCNGDRSGTSTYTANANFGNGYFGTTAVSSAGTNASGNGIFEFDVPTGYTALSTKGLNL